MRWAAPVAAVAVVGGAVTVAGASAGADSGLKPRSAAQLLVDVENARVGDLSGTVVQTSNLGLPSLPGVSSGSGTGNSASSSLSSMVTGAHTWRVWYASPSQVRLALVGGLGESDVIRNGSNLWVWSSQDKSATHYTLPAHGSGGMAETTNPKDLVRPGNPSRPDIPRTPQEAAQQALAAITPSTSVATSATATVAGRPAYELVLTPRDAASKVHQVRIAIDAAKHIPLRVQVYASHVAKPAFEVGFTSVDFAKPEARQFTFTPPPGTTVKQSTAMAHPLRTKAPKAAEGTNANAPKVIGKGWGSVMVAKLPAGAMTESGSGTPSGQTRQLQAVLRALPKVSGTWGSGRLFNGTLFSAVLTDDGRVAVGAVNPQSLYAALVAAR